MSDTFRTLKMEPGETIEAFLAQFDKLPKNGVLNWDAIGGAFRNLSPEPDSDRKILRLPVR